MVPPAGYGDFLISTTKMVVDYVRYYAPTTTVYWTGASSAQLEPHAANWLPSRTPTRGGDVVFSYLSRRQYGISLGRDTAVERLVH